MSWLIEAFLDEAEYATQERPGQWKNSRGVSCSHVKHNDYGEYVVPRNSRAKDKSDPPLCQGNSSKYNWDDVSEKRKAQRDKLKKEYKQAENFAKKQLKPSAFKKADPEAVAQAADAKARHDRRHPELKKAANESADLIEILQ